MQQQQQLGRLSDICSIWSWTLWACQLWTSTIPAGHFRGVITFTLNTLPINLYIYHGWISQQDQVWVTIRAKLKEHVPVLLSCFLLIWSIVTAEKFSCLVPYLEISFYSSPGLWSLKMHGLTWSKYIISLFVIAYKLKWIISLHAWLSDSGQMFLMKLDLVCCYVIVLCSALCSPIWKITLCRDWGIIRYSDEPNMLTFLVLVCSAVSLALIVLFCGWGQSVAVSSMRTCKGLYLHAYTVSRGD